MGCTDFKKLCKSLTTHIAIWVVLFAGIGIMLMVMLVLGVLRFDWYTGTCTVLDHETQKIDYTYQVNGKWVSQQRYIPVWKVKYDTISVPKINGTNYIQYDDDYISIPQAKHILERYPIGYLQDCYLLCPACSKKPLIYNATEILWVDDTNMFELYNIFYSMLLCAISILCIILCLVAIRCYKKPSSCHRNQSNNVPMQPRPIQNINNERQRRQSNRPASRNQPDDNV